MSKSNFEVTVWVGCHDDGTINLFNDEPELFTLPSGDKDWSGVYSPLDNADEIIDAIDFTDYVSCGTCRQFTVTFAPTQTQGE